MSLPKRVQRDLDAANAQEIAFQTARSEHTATTVLSASDLTAIAPADTPPTDPPVAVAPVAPPAPPREDFEHKYRVLQGMYEADVKVVKQNQARLDSRLAAIEQAPVHTERPQPDAKDIETFGADLIAMVQRYAEGQAAAVDARLKALESKVTGVAQRAESNAEQTFFKELTALVPDVAEINQDVTWLAWLGVVDDIYGVTRQRALNDARSSLNVKRVAAIFNQFKATLPKPSEEAPSSLASQVSPTGAGSTTPSPAAPVQYLSEKSITDFYNQVSRGEFKGREDEMNAIEARINLAVAENRVR